MILFESPRLRARPFRYPDDVESTFDLYSRPEVVRYIGMEPASRELAKDLVRKRAEREASSPYGPFVVEDRATSQHIGTAIFKQAPNNDGSPSGMHEIGWHLHPNFWGQGLGTEMGQAICDYAFRVMPDLKEVIALADPQNVASQRIMQKIGMEYAGSSNCFYNQCTEQYRISREKAQDRVSVRRASAVDATEIQRVIKAVYDEYDFGWFPDDYHLDLYEFDRHYTELDYPFYVAEHRGKIIGTGALAFHERIPGESGTTVVDGVVRIAGSDCSTERLYVDPSARRLGAARALCDSIMIEARYRGCKRMEIWSDTSFEAAHALYLKLGATMQGDRLCHDPAQSPEYGLALDL